MTNIWSKWILTCGTTIEILRTPKDKPENFEAIEKNVIFLLMTHYINRYKIEEKIIKYIFDKS